MGTVKSMRRAGTAISIPKRLNLTLLSTTFSEVAEVVVGSASTSSVVEIDVGAVSGIGGSGGEVLLVWSASAREVIGFVDSFVFGISEVIRSRREKECPRRKSNVDGEALLCRRRYGRIVSNRRRVDTCRRAESAWSGRHVEEENALSGILGSGNPTASLKSEGVLRNIGDRDGYFVQVSDGLANQQAEIQNPDWIGFLVGPNRGSDSNISQWQARAPMGGRMHSATAK